MLYSLFRILFKIMFTMLFRWQVHGTENIPEKGPVILVSNHISNLDPPLLGAPLQRKVSFMAKEQLFHIPVVSFLIRSFGAFPVKRGAADRQSIRMALTILKEDGVVGIFPEGTRSKTGELGKGMSGAALFALRTDAAVIPVAILGPYRLFRPIRIIYGQPMDITHFKQMPSSTDTYQQATEYMMTSIQALMDENRQ